MAIHTLYKFQYLVKNYREVNSLILCKIFSILNNHKSLEDLNAQHHDLLPNDVTAETFIDFDVDVSVTLPTPSTDEEILQAARSEESISDDEDRENEVEEEETIVQPKNTDVQNALDLLLRGARFFHQLGGEMRKMP